MSDQIVLEVIEKYAQRSEIGIAKYGTTLETNNKDNYLKHLQEELMDALASNQAQVAPIFCIRVHSSDAKDTGSGFQ